LEFVFLEQEIEKPLFSVCARESAQLGKKHGRQQT